MKEWKTRLEFLEKEIAALDGQIAKKLKPFAAQMELLQSLPGVDHTTAGQRVGRDWNRYDALSDSWPVGFLGRVVSRESRRCRCPRERPHPAWQRHFAFHSHSVCLGGGAHQGHQA